MQIHIVKLELYPTEEPTGYAVGFNITTGNNRQFYRDTIVPLELCQGKDDGEIVDLAWTQLKSGIEDEVIRLESKSNLLGGTWIPPSNESTIDKTELETIILSAQGLILNAAEGTEVGQYQTGAIVDLQIAVDEAIIVKDNLESEQVDIDAEEAILQNGISAFELRRNL